MAKKDGRISSQVTGKTPPKGAGQTSGKVKHARMDVAPKVETLKGFSE